MTPAALAEDSFRLLVQGLTTPELMRLRDHLAAGPGDRLPLGDNPGFPINLDPLAKNARGKGFAELIATILINDWLPAARKRGLVLDDLHAIRPYLSMLAYGEWAGNCDRHRVRQIIAEIMDHTAERKKAAPHPA